MPSVYSGNTGANMTVMLLPNFINSLDLVNEDAYIVAHTASGLVIGSTSVYGLSQNSLAIWGDDSLTPDIEGALTGEEVYFQLVDGSILYDIYDESDLLLTVNYTNGGIQGLDNIVNATLNCSIEGVEGCTDPLYLEYNESATVDDGSCITFIVDGCTDNTAVNYNPAATLDDGSCEYDSSTCDLPTPFTGNTGSNMTVMLLPGMVSSMTVVDEDAFVIAVTESGMTIGSIPIYGVFQNQIALWGDDTTTPEVDGAIGGESIYFQLIDGANVYDLYDGGIILSVSFAANGFQGFNSGVTSTLNCIGVVAEVIGCTDSDACNYTAEANTDDGSCFFAADYYDCNGQCLLDSDSDGVCDALEVSGCTDPLATNYNDLATDNDGSCEYPPVIEGCTDANANNYNSLANTDDGSCLYGIGGCTYDEAENYYYEAAYDDGTCIFDVPYIYLTNPIDGGVHSTSAIDIVFEVQNVTIGFPSVAPLGGHIKYSIDGGTLASDFNQEGIISQDFTDGEHTIQFILYNNVSGDIAPWSPAVETTIVFTVGPEGCMDSTSGNYNPLAVIDDGSCLPNAAVDFDFTNTGVNHTIMLLDDIGTISIGGLEVQVGDLIGVFYLSDGVYNCAGSVVWSGNMEQLAAMGDDTTTPEQDGFLSGQEFVWAVQFTETGNSVFLEATYSSTGMNTFSTNSISSIISFNVMEFEGVLGCMDSDYIEYNPLATIAVPESCITLKVYGCSDDSYIEYWSYDSVNLTISELEAPANTDDGSCETLIISGCTNTGYFDFCDFCNLSDPGSCNQIIIEGCIDSIADNFDPIANISDGSCEYDICIQFELNNFLIEYSSSLGVVVLSYDLINISDQIVFEPTLNINLNDSTYFVLGDMDYSISQIYPSDTVTVNTVITNDLTALPLFVSLSGQVNLAGVADALEGENVDCLFDFNEILVNTSHIGCTSPTAYNYEEIATIDDGSCVDNLNASIVVFDPICTDDYGSATIYVTGGFPTYSSPNTYTSYSSLGVPSFDIPVEFNAEGVAYMSGLVVGDYVVEVHDDSEVVSFYNFTISNADSISVTAQVLTSGLLTSTIVFGDVVLYQWLLNGETIDGANALIHYAESIGEYQVYVENAQGCGAYSSPVALGFVGIEDLSLKSFSLYPNPAQTNINIRLLQQQALISVSLTDVLGQEISSIQIDARASTVDYNFDVSALPNGLYFIKVSNDQSQVVKRFVKN
jgi:hypothetical protein